MIIKRCMRIMQRVNLNDCSRRFFSNKSSVYLNKKPNICLRLGNLIQLANFSAVSNKANQAIMDLEINKNCFQKPPRLEWWQTEVIYEIYVPTFNDSNGDGIGDLRGIIKKLDYLKSIGANTIWLSPIYPSGGKDGGYDVTCMTDVDPAYGTMEDFDELVRKVHEKGMHILLDFIPNHTSDKHRWFEESSKNNDPNNPFRDYYVWCESEDSVNPPTNWISVFGHSAWTYNKTRKAWYLHQFLVEQPELNLRCPGVKKELTNTIKFWLEQKNVDGFRMDALKFLYESETFKDEPLANSNVSPNKEVVYDDLVHVYTANQVETYEQLLEWRALFDEIGKRKNSVKALVVEATYSVNEIKEYYCYENKPSAHFAFNFQLINIKQKSPSEKNENESADWVNSLTKEQLEERSFIPRNLKRLIEEYFEHKPDHCWSNWVMGNHDMMRVGSRVGKENINTANALNLLLDGTAVVYNGEEIGMMDLPRDFLKFEDCKDESGIKYGPQRFLFHTRDYQRSPMQWSGLSKCAGFSTNEKPWLPIHPNYKSVNVESQLHDSKSHLSVFKDLVKLRAEPSFQWGKLELILANDQVFAFVRRAYGFPVFLVAMNLSGSVTNVNLCLNNNIASCARVVYYIPGCVNGSDDSVDYKLDSAVLTDNVLLKPYDTLVLTWHSA